MPRPASPYRPGVRLRGIHAPELREFEFDAPSIKGVPDAGTLWVAEAKEATKRVPAVKKLSFDGSEFRIGNNAASDYDIAALIKQVDPTFERGVGPSTAKRAALLKWAKKQADPKPASFDRLKQLMAGGAAATVGLAALQGQSQDSD